MTRWGIIGTGKIACAFAEALRVVENSHVVAIGSRSRESAARLAKFVPDARVHLSYERLVRDDAVDVVYVATPHTEHRAATLLALENGKSVLCEKPFAVNHSEATQMVQAARERKLFLMEAMWTRFTPAMREAVRLVKDGVIGRPRSLVVDLGWYSEPDPSHRLRNMELGGGALLDIGVYPVSLAHLLFGRPVNVVAASTRAVTGADEQTGAVLTHGAGELTSFACTIQADSPAHATLLGTHGHISIDRFYNPTSFEVLRNGDEPVRHEFPHRGNGMEHEAEEVSRCLAAGLLESPLMTLEETLSIMAVMDEIRSRIGLRYPADMIPVG
ncbi:Gfo/Idh/MocA family oxidoreductase [Streptomyces sp. ISL-98]|uniref:Gfo/Idh/MocA family protein n=1 Tax=Streptomyces sp. ISL-98 TaxID=2819192 RepID=UPI001BECBE01|nr:Gfo/Idh/MocA family oxidoreductase [Streptomyces sp. ISL-98]MBT2511297.1 Gfo/Idh/MocA family oxidoreductase [Streptomyces sp. ISL-98]